MGDRRIHLSAREAAALEDALGLADRVPLDLPPPALAATAASV